MTKTRKVPVYGTKQVPYTVKERKTTKLPPIVPGDHLTIVFTRFAGGNVPTVEQVQENIKLGFQIQQNNDKNIVKIIKYVSRAELLRSLTKTELEEMGPRVEQILRNTYGANIICTGTILSTTEHQLSIEILDYRKNKIYNDIFKGDSWSSVGSEVAQAFFGTRIKTDYVKITKYKDEQYLMGYKEEQYKERQSYELAWRWGIVLLVLILAIPYIG